MAGTNRTRAVVYIERPGKALGFCACGCGQPAHDRHHGLIGRRKGYPVLDDERNLIPVNHWEHINRKFDNQFWRRKFWKRQVEIYGLPAMMEWIDAIPEKMKKTRLDFLRD